MATTKKRLVLNLAGGTVVVLWLVMIGLLIRKIHFSDLSPPAEVSTEISHVKSQQRDWMEIYLKDKKVGYSVNQIDPLGDGYLIQEEIFLKLNLMGQGSSLRTVSRSVVDDKFSVKSFNFNMSSGVVAFQVSGKVTGKKMRLKIGEGRTQRVETIELSAPPVMGSGIAQFFKGRKIEIGQSFMFPIFDPSTMARKEMIFRVLAKETIVINGIEYPSFRIETEMWGTHLTFWLDEKGVLLKETGFMGLTLIKSSPATAPRDISSGGDFYELAAISVKRKLHDTDKLTFLKLAVEGLEKSTLDRGSLDGGRQRFGNGVMKIVREEIPVKGTYILPYQGQSEEMKPLLQPEFNIESDDNTVIEKAREVSGDLKDPVQVARALMGWVYRNVEKRPLVTVPSALEVLKNKVGDCNEHAVLLTALLRASGIPARVCVGLVYTRGKFFYHAWTEAYVGKWISMDATLNQMPVDATHIRLARGGLDKQLDIIGLIGKLKLKVIAFGYE